MKLIKLTLENFQGIKQFTLEPNGASMNVYGANGTGKTTLFNGLTWLLFGKASDNEPNYSPKTIDIDGSERHFLEHKVEGVFLLENGQILRLSKIFKERYKKPKGALQEELAGHTTVYAIDGVVSNEREYDALIDRICSKDKAKILSMPTYFPQELDWQSRRQVLISIFGQISDSEVIALDAELEPLQEMLLKTGTTNQYYTIDELQKIVKAEQKNLNEQMKLLPARIDEAEKAITDVELSAEEIQSRLKVLQERHEAYQQEKEQITADEGKGLIMQRMAEAKTMLAEKKAAFIQSQQEISDKLNSQYGQLMQQKADINSEIYQMQNNKLEQTNRVCRMNEKRQSLLKQLDDINHEKYEPTTTCFACGQPLPAEKLENDRQQFNLNKAKRIDAVNQQGSKECSKEMIAQAEEAVKRYENKLMELQKQEQLVAEQLTKVKQQKNQLPAFIPPTDITDFIKSCEAMLRNEQHAQQGLTAEINEKISQNQQEISRYNQLLAQLESNAKQKERVQELMTLEKQFNADKEQLDYKAYLCNQFIQAKMRCLSDKINQHFDKIQFRLFNQQINGSVVEDCQVLVRCANALVPYQSANKASKINAGLEIIEKLGQAWDLMLPVFIDNAESVSEINPINAQVIRLVVSRDDRQLRAVTVEETEFSTGVSA